MSKQTRPWYRQPLVWMIIALPSSAVIAGFFTLWLAIVSDDGMVVDDYYRKGKEINLDLSRNKAALTHGLSAGIDINYPRGTISLTLSSSNNYTLPAQLELHLLYSTRAGHDVTLSMIRTPSGAYFSALPTSLIEGRWYILLQADDWRLLGSVRIPVETAISLTAGN